jgi:hypothetical protein
MHGIGEEGEGEIGPESDHGSKGRPYSIPEE